MKKIATGLASGTKATPELAIKAVKAAMDKSAIKSPSAVLLFLTSEFAFDPAPAIQAAAKTAGCTQIIGCSATGIFTEEDWILDSPAAAAMVFSDTASLTVIKDQLNTQPLLTLSAPHAMNSTWLHEPGLRFGGVSGDATGHGSFSVWKSGKGVTEGHCEVMLKNAEVAVAASHGLKHISTPQKITKTNEYEILTLNKIAALTNLENAWQALHKKDEELPFHQLVAASASSVEAFEQGEHNVSSIIASNDETGAITLSNDLQVGDFLSWALRDANTAQIDIVKTAGKLKEQLTADPAFAMMFSCLGRGPWFYDGSDQDLELLKTLHPQLPIIGFYGNAEIAPISGRNEMLQYSAVLSLFAESSNP